VSVIMNTDGGRPNFSNDKFETMLHLKDNELSDTSSIWLTTKGCVLRNAIVHCSAKSVVATGIGSGSARQELTAYISRKTGEYNFFLENWSYAGPNASGKQIANMKLHRSGICRQVSKPIF